MTKVLSLAVTLACAWIAAASALAGGSGGVTGAAFYVDGQSVDLTATPGAGFVFTGWSGDCTGTGACSVSMSQDRSVTATFAGPYSRLAAGSTCPANAFAINCMP